MPHRTMARFRAVAAVSSLTLVLSLLAAGAAQAQFLPAVLYGTGLQSGQAVEAFIDGQSCASTMTNEQGEWVMQVAPEAPCAPAAGASITFTVDGQEATADPPATWESGGIPSANVRSGYALTVEGGTGNDGGETPASEEEDGGGSNAMLLIAGGVVVLAAAAAGGFFLFRRNA